MFVVLYQYSPNGRNDRGEFSACVSDGLAFGTKEEACSYIKGKWEALKAEEAEKGSGLDPEWAEKISDEDMEATGYSRAKDFSRVEFEYESRYPDVPPEPKFSWTVVEAKPRGGK